MASHASIPGAGGVGRSATWRIVRLALFHQASGLSRTDSRTTASGWAALSSRQNPEAGQSTAAS
jgi:hypothetical protein